MSGEFNPNDYEKGEADPTLVKAAVNKDMRDLFGVEENQDFKPGFTHYEAIEGGSPEVIEYFKVGERSFGAEYYLPERAHDKGIWVIAEHGYAGRARDFSRLADILKKRGFGLMSLDMHQNGKDDFERLSMKIDDWAEAAYEANNRLRFYLKNEGRRINKILFVGQSSGGSSGASILVRGKANHPFSGAILIGPTLKTVHPELVAKMDEIVDRWVRKDEDVMLDYNWLAPLMNQCKDKDMNFAYQAHFATLPGFPYKHARQAIAIDNDIIGKIDKIDVPTVMIKGAEDNEDTESFKAVTAALTGKPNGFLFVEDDVKDAGHHVEIEKPEAIAEIVKKIAEEGSYKKG